MVGGPSRIIRSGMAATVGTTVERGDRPGGLSQSHSLTQRFSDVFSYVCPPNLRIFLHTFFNVRLLYSAQNNKHPSHERYPWIVYASRGSMGSLRSQTTHRRFFRTAVAHRQHQAEKVCRTPPRRWRCHDRKSDCGNEVQGFARRRSFRDDELHRI